MVMKKGLLLLIFVGCLLTLSAVSAVDVDNSTDNVTVDEVIDDLEVNTDSVDNDSNLDSASSQNVGLLVSKVMDGSANKEPSLKSLSTVALEIVKDVNDKIKNKVKIVAADFHAKFKIDNFVIKELEYLGKWSLKSSQHREAFYSIAHYRK